MTYRTNFKFFEKIIFCPTILNYMIYANFQYILFFVGHFLFGQLLFLSKKLLIFFSLLNFKDLKIKTGVKMKI